MDAGDQIIGDVMSFDTTHHLAAKTIGLAPLVRLLNNVQKTGPGALTVPSPREVMIMRENIRDNDYRGVIRYADASGSTRGWGNWTVHGSGMQQALHKIYGAGMEITESGQYVKEQHANNANRDIIANLSKAFVIAFWASPSPNTPCLLYTSDAADE